MAKTLKDLVALVEREARKEGPGAQAELATYRAFYRVARAIAARRAELRITQQGLAGRSGIRQSEISRIESGKANPTFATLTAIAVSLRSQIVLLPCSRGTGRPHRGGARRAARR